MLKIGLVGCGNWGKNILRDLLSLGCRVYVADIDPAAQERAAGMGASWVFASADGLPECDGYVAAVTIPELTPVCADLLRHRKPVFCENTLLRSENDYALLKSKKGDDLVFAMHKWHYHPGIEGLRQVAVSGKIGGLKQIHTIRHAWVNDFHGGDVFWTQAVHDITIIKHILGEIPGRVEDIHVVKHEGTPVGFIAVMGESPAVFMSVSGKHCEKRSGVSLIGSAGAAQLFNAYDQEILIRTQAGEERMKIDTTFPLYLELKEFTEYFEGGRRPRCGLEEAWEATCAILRLRHAAGLEI